ncbi:uncharacterized protein N7506_010325 [Penicillium brevicompactum]|uniref:uncharacterized protein n=1 Tax=Penicillium brevicompactum TaxID=5074 RepID=UPI002541D503|nr:uncharacterized protein N7506_010325 [Penicillium brevicompactum]KAJ5327223.1 hypothetical protein N7506_010325 [Penicillium brevicompactum]
MHYLLSARLSPLTSCLDFHLYFILLFVFLSPLTAFHFSLILLHIPFIKGRPHSDCYLCAR